MKLVFCSLVIDGDISFEKEMIAAWHDVLVEGLSYFLYEEKNGENEEINFSLRK